MQIEMEMVKVVIYPDGRLDTDNAARFLGLSPKTLAIMRSVGNGPRFVKRGRVFYFLDDLQSWISERPRVRSAAQAQGLTTTGNQPQNGLRKTSANR